ncbi:MAG TPA: ABC transporter permease [Anaerolineaceae bacterium]|jgi:simple sugar transport system permease protein|nr:ABC transporter permease [Anaerolineaceae bacterium]
METILTTGFIVGLLSAGIRLAAPILVAALGETVAERSGLMNIGIEGMMLMGALFAVFGSDISQNAWVGVLFALLIGALMGLLFAFTTVTLLCDQVVIGMAINIFALGITSYLFRLAYGLNGQTHSVPAFDPVQIPFLSQIPIIGPIFFQQTILIYLSYLLVPVMSFLLFKTMWGLALRANGDHPRAVDTMGIDVIKNRYVAIMIGGAFAGLGGAILSLSHMNVFVDNITAGRGYIALAAVIFGQWSPLGALFSSLLFGVADATQLRLQQLSDVIPYQLVASLPYVLTVLALVGIIGKASPPKSLAVPYTRDGDSH